MALRKGKEKPKVTMPATKEEYEKFKKKNYKNGVPHGYTKESYWAMMDFFFEAGQFKVIYTVEE